MESFGAELQACIPTRGVYRADRVEAGNDLLGDWLVDVIYGRIGSPGRLIRHVAADEAVAIKIVCHCLQRRAAAPRWAGAAYQLRELRDPGQGIWAACPCGR